MLILIAGEVLLYITSSEMKSFIINSIILVFLYAVLLIVISAVVTKKILAYFKPIDEITNVDEKGNRSLNDLANLYMENSRKSSDLNDKLRFVKEDLNKNIKENERKDSLFLSSKETLKKISDNNIYLANKYEIFFNSEKEILFELQLVLDKLKNESDSVNSIGSSSFKTINDYKNVLEDFVLDFNDIENAYNVLCKALNESSDCIDQVFSEITGLQSNCSQIGLYALNLSLECSRQGVMNLSVSTALDEIINMTKKLSDVSDSVALNIIKFKNATKLALDQTSFCDEQSRQCIHDFDNMNEKNDLLSQKIFKLTSSLEAVNSNVNEISKCSNRITELNDDLNVLNNKFKEQNSLVNDFADMLI